MIKLTELTFGYPRKDRIIGNISLTLSPGHVYGLLGKNGVGKTTLLKIVVGLLFPHAGECLVDAL